MTQEEKARAYDKAIEAARCIYNNMKEGGNFGGMEDLSVIFPELEESEGEHARNMLTALVTWAKSYSESGITEEDAEMLLSWLEKQSQPSPAKEYTFKAIPRLLELMQPTSRAKSYCQKLIDSLEQEGYSADAKIVRGRLKLMEGETVAMATMDEQPPAKVEPKFKVGDWVIGRSTNNEPRQIAEVTEEGYKSTYGGWYGFSFEEGMHLWDICDAEDGDLLAFVDHGKVVVGIVSFVSETTGKVDVSCLLEDNKFKIGTFYALDTIDPHPATKEQRNLFFQKMKEEGYEWDSDKKVCAKMNK